MRPTSRESPTTAGAGNAAVHQGVLFLFAGVLVYAVLAGRRIREGRSAAGAPPFSVDGPRV
jgi:basic amino acid/polyamine antiporter, APA family